MGLRDKMNRLERAAEKDLVTLQLKDGTAKAFDRMTVGAELYILMYNRAIGEPPRESPFMDAWANATEESRREVMASREGAWYSDLSDAEMEPGGEPPEDLSV
jgi:hypothetical protein